MESSLHVLVVGGSRSWVEAARCALAGAGGSVVEEVGCGPEAIWRILTVPRPFSHVLVEAACPHDLVQELHGLTGGEAGSATRLLLLGAPAFPVPGIPVVLHADPLALGDALAPANAAPHAAPPAAPALSADELLDAIRGPMMDVRYQPVVRTRDGSCVGLEALARINHPVHGTLPPSRFVPHLEQAGFGLHLTDVVARRAMAELAGIRLLGFDLTMALNFPLDTIMLPALPDWLNTRCEAAGVSAPHIMIELVETRPVEDFPALGQAVAALRRDGYGVAIDDLSPTLAFQRSLLNMPFTAAKLDVHVTRDMHEADGHGFLVDAVATAHANGLTIIAEGVEDHAAWCHLRELGVDCVQGFLISRPLPARTLPVWLQAWAERRTPSAHLLRGSPDQTSS